MAAQWIREGAIGKLREVHNWSNRPVWPQYATIPVEQPPVPKDFDWDLWLGPSLPRPYHPHYTHAVFRGWYEFGGGSLADMGHYSLWRVFAELNLDAPIAVESTPSHVCAISDHVSARIHNDYSFPAACTIRFKFGAKPGRQAIDLFWYDGGMKPPTPDELEADNKQLPAEGMMFVGDKGRILAGFRCEDPRIIPEQRSREYWGVKGPPAPTAPGRGRSEAGRDPGWVRAFKGGEPTNGNFLSGWANFRGLQPGGDFVAAGRQAVGLGLSSDEDLELAGGEQIPDPRISKRLGTRCLMFAALKAAPSVFAH